MNEHISHIDNSHHIHPQTFLDGRVTLYGGDSRDVLRVIPDCSIDSIVTDPPYAINFMNKGWDTGDTVLSIAFWIECLRVLKPGGHVVAFSGTRTYHRMACAIEDAGFEIRDQLSWIFGSGFPKSQNVSKQLDKMAGAEREIIVERTLNNNRFAISGSGVAQERFRKFEGNANITAPSTDAAKKWEGWGSALKPAHEPICLARKPFVGTIAANVLAHGTGAINVDGCRIGVESNLNAGRFPANVVHDGSEEVLAGFPATAPSPTGLITQGGGAFGSGAPRGDKSFQGHGDTGSAARFFYSAKANANDRIGSKHPTVKPVDLMQWLCRLITPPNGTILDPFAGTGSTGEAAWREGFSAILIEREIEYQADIARRMELAPADKADRKAAIAAIKLIPVDNLFRMAMTIDYKTQLELAEYQAEQND